MDSFHHKKMRINGITLNVVCEGDESAPLIILLHGFPECWITWQEQIKPLAKAGYRIWAPDQRGYNLSDKPKAVADYNINQLAKDVDELRNMAGTDQFHLVGHDWGAAVAWWYALHYPEHLKTLTVINVPHPQVMLDTLKRSPKQLFKSWYMFFFQIPKLPESILALRQFRMLRRGLLTSSTPNAFSTHTLNSLLQAWQQPGAITGMLNWYRSALRKPQQAEHNQVSVPTRILWGENDIALTKEMAQSSAELCNKATLTYYSGATHWLPHDKPEVVTREILHFCDAH